MERIDRLKEAIKQIKITRGKRLTNDNISEELGYTSTYVSDILGETKDVTKPFLKRIELEYSISAEWVWEGTGDRFVTKTGDNTQVEEPSAPFGGRRRRTGKTGWPGVPVFDTPVASGIINHKSAPVGYVSLSRFMDCSFAIQVSGEEMNPKICSGDYICCKEVDINEIIQGDVYLIVTNKGNEIVRYAQPHKTKSGYLSLTSEKQPKSPTSLAISAIRKIYKIKGVVKSY